MENLFRIIFLVGMGSCLVGCSVLRVYLRGWDVKLIKICVVDKVKCKWDAVEAADAEVH